MNSLRVTIGLIAAAICAPLIFGAAQIGYRVIMVCYKATDLRLAGGGRDLPVTPYASSDAALARLGTSVRAIDDIRGRVDPHGDLIVLASRAEPPGRGAFYLQLQYFLNTYTVAQLDCREPSGLVMPPGPEKRIAGVVYQSMPPPVRVTAGRNPIAMGRDAGKPIFFVPVSGSVPEVNGWTQLCR